MFFVSGGAFKEDDNRPLDILYEAENVNYFDWHNEYFFLNKAINILHHILLPLSYSSLQVLQYYLRPHYLLKINGNALHAMV